MYFYFYCIKNPQKIEIKLQKYNMFSFPIASKKDISLLWPAPCSRWDIVSIFLPKDESSIAELIWDKSSVRSAVCSPREWKKLVSEMEGSFPNSVVNSILHTLKIQNVNKKIGGKVSHVRSWNKIISSIENIEILDQGFLENKI